MCCGRVCTYTCVHLRCACVSLECKGLVCVCGYVLGCLAWIEYERDAAWFVAAAAAPALPGVAVAAAPLPAGLRFCGACRGGCRGVPRLLQC